MAYALGWPDYHGAHVLLARSDRSSVGYPLLDRLGSELAFSQERNQVDRWAVKNPAPSRRGVPLFLVYTNIWYYISGKYLRAYEHLDSRPVCEFMRQDEIPEQPDVVAPRVLRQSYRFSEVWLANLDKLVNVTLTTVDPKSPHQPNEDKG